MVAADVVVDDHLLLRILLDDEPAGLRSLDSQVFTTGLWYHRLCRAIGVPSVVGTLSRALGAADPLLGAAAIRSITTLPADIGLVSLRDLAWPMARLLDDGVALNLLSLEALAATEHLGATLCLAAADENPPLLTSAAARRTPNRVITT